MNRTRTRSLRGATSRCGMALAIAALGMGLVPAVAQTEAPAARETRPARQEVGARVRGLLEIQRSGAQAGQAQQLHGEQAALSYQRYMATFTHPIPEFYIGQAGAQKGSGSGMGQGTVGR